MSIRPQLCNTALSLLCKIRCAADVDVRAREDREDGAHEECGRVASASEDHGCARRGHAANENATLGCGCAGCARAPARRLGCPSAARRPGPVPCLNNLRRGYNPPVIGKESKRENENFVHSCEKAESVQSRKMLYDSRRAAG